VVRKEFMGCRIGLLTATSLVLLLVLAALAPARPGSAGSVAPNPSSGPAVPATPILVSEKVSRTGTAAPPARPLGGAVAPAREAAVPWGGGGPRPQVSVNVSSIGVGSRPGVAAYDSANGDVYVPNYGSDNVSVIDGTALVASLNVGHRPSAAVFDSGNGDVYVLDSGADNVSVIHGTSLVGTVKVGQLPMYATCDSQNGYAYVVDVGNGSNSGNVSVIDGTTLVGTIAVGWAASWPAYDSSDGYVYVPSMASGKVSVIDGATLVSSVDVGGNPYAATYDPKNGYVYVADAANQGPDNITVIQNTSVVGTVEVGQPGETYEGYQGAIPAYDDRNGYVYIPNFGAGNVTVVSGTTLVGWVNVGSWPVSATYDGGNGYVYVVNWASDSVSEVNGTRVVATVGVADAPGDSVYDGGNGYIYVTDSGSDRVSALILKYPVALMESGLPAGTQWWVNVSGGPVGLTPSNALSFDLYFGAYSYLAGTTDRAYRAQAGSFTVNGSSSPDVVNFSAVTYRVGFTETGLPGGVEWWVNLTGGFSGSSVSASLSFAEFNGSYRYAVATTDKLYEAAGASFAVHGAAVSKAVTFSPVNYTVSFTEIGLPVGSGWSVVLGGVRNSTTATMVDFPEPNGTYAYTIGPLPGWTPAKSSGSVVVNGGPVAAQVAWERTTYTATFEETGLAPGTNWTVIFNEVPESATGNLTFAGILNGTYTFTVTPVTGYTATPDHGSVIVRGPPPPQAIAFTPLGRGGGNASSPTLGLAPVVLVGVAGGLAVIAAVLLLRRRRHP
jgi:YVTN family beta-propeller protein